MRDAEIFACHGVCLSALGAPVPRGKFRARRMCATATSAVGGEKKKKRNIRRVVLLLLQPSIENRKQRNNKHEAQEGSMMSLIVKIYVVFFTSSLRMLAWAYVYPWALSEGSLSRKTRHRLFLAPQQLGSFEELSFSREERNIALYDWTESDPLPFTDVWDFQKSLVQSHLDRLSKDLSSKDNQSGTSSSQFICVDEQKSRSIIDQGDKSGLDSVIMLQHEPVYTLGTGSDPSFIRDTENVDIVRMDRGGEVTYHGPGQLVAYPILDLRSYQKDIHWYMRALEESILLALDYAGVQKATREDDVTGVWIDDAKVAAIGIKARRWVTMHGLAVNIEESSLENFVGIVPCGLEGRRVTCVNHHLENPITVSEFALHLQAALEEVFKVRLQAAPDSPGVVLDSTLEKTITQNA